MLSTFRRLIYSRVGLVVAFILFGLFGFAMVGGDMSSIRTQGMAALGGSDAVAHVDGTSVSTADYQRRLEQVFDNDRQQTPTLTMADFVAAGRLEQVLQALTGGLALDAFGHDQGIVVSRRAVDGQIASIPGLQGPDGQFDPRAFRQLLQQQKLTEKGVREDLSRGMMEQLLTSPILRANTAPRQLAVPYANLSLEKREGVIAFVPTRAMAAGPAPTDTELQAFYGRNLPRYTVAERRAVRFARVSPDQVRARATPTGAEIAQAYAADRAKYAATEKRTVTQVVVLDQASADRLAARVKGGTPLVAAATAAGLSSSTLTGLTKADMATQASPALADAVFAAAPNAIVGPVRGGLGFVVARVEKVEQVAGRTLAQVRGEIAAALTTQKTADALNSLRDGIDGALAENATFDEIVRDRGLAAQATPALLANGADPDRPGAPDATLAPLLTAAFGMQEGDEPQLVATGPDGSFALVALGRVVHAAPRPLAQVREQVMREVLADRARQAARRVAGQILQRVGRGASMADAWAQAGINAEAPKPLNASREQLERAQGPSRGPLALMFAMAPNTVKLLEAPGGAGWAVIRLNRIQPGDASRDAPRIDQYRRAFGQVVGREYADQFARAAQVAVGVTTNRDAVAKVKAQLLTRGGGAQ